MGMRQSDAERATAVWGQGLQKVFARKGRPAVHALKGVDFIVRAGTLTALVGPDGAGKTTLMRLVAGLSSPTAGQLRVTGLDLAAGERTVQEVQSRLSYMPQKFGLYEDLTVTENLALYADLHGVVQEARKARFQKLLAMTGLGAFAGRLAGKLSGGMKQKLGLACTLVRSPKLLLLDEPTVGVDPLSRRELWEILRQMAEEEHISTFVSTAYMDEAARCDTVYVLDRGEMLFAGTPAELGARAGSVEGGFLALLAYAAEKRGEAAASPDSSSSRRKAEAASRAPVEIEVRDLVKRFGRFTAVSHTSFSVHRGEVFGLLGPNGAGKTTTFRMLCGLLPATSGTLRVAGVDLRRARREARRSIGYVAQKFSLYKDLTARENLAFFGGIYGLCGAHLAARIKAVADEFELGARLGDAAGSLPGGYKQRLSMAAAMLHEPRILFLDEPTSGIDPLARRTFWQQIRRFAAGGTTIVITTHFMEEAEHCDRFMIQDHGEMLVLGSPAAIRREMGMADAGMNEIFIAIVERARGAKAQGTKGEREHGT